MPSSALRATAAEWARHDPNPTTAQYVRSADDATLESLFNVPRIGFGTAGLRSAMKPGPAGMNDLVVVQTAQGLVKYCESLGLPKRAVVAYDHRRQGDYNISSHSFALFTCLVFRQAGWECLLLDGYSMTPLVPFCVKQTESSVGIMITASHNPKQDAGYKVYWKDACQIRSPMDSAIAASIQQNLQPWADYSQQLKAKKEQHPEQTCFGLSESADPYIDAYFDALHKSGLVSPSSAGNVTKPRFCYTAMHGIGHRFAVRSFATFQLPPFVSVPQQQEPNPDFPTVAFPNPEEVGALDLAQETANEHNCDIVLANDPDADRLAVAEKQPDSGDWKVFKGDEIGAMLGLWLYRRFQKDKVAMCASTVSSKLLQEIARVEGFHFQDTLTGFKWIGSRLAELKEAGYKSVFGYEEAIGFACGDVVFDKDGISALGVMGELAVHVYGQNQTLAEYLQGIYDKYGEFVSNNGYYFLNEPGTAGKILQHMCSVLQIGAEPPSGRAVGKYKVVSVRYLGEPGYDSTKEDRKPSLPTSKSSPMMTVCFENGCVAQFRASGTEPKFKYYIELKGAPGVAKETVNKELIEMCNVILEELVQPGKYGLK